MALDTYANLLTSIAGFLNRTDLTAVIPDFVTLAESQMHRRFVGRMRQALPYPRRVVVRDDLDISSGDEYVALPTDFAGALTLSLDSSPITELDYLQEENFQQEKARNYWTGAPKFYTIVGSQIQLFPVADQDYTGELTYISRFPALSVSNASNWILASYPDAYLYGALLQSAPYLGDDNRIAIWGGLFTAAVDEICMADPMPSDKTKLRTEIALLGRPWGASGQYDINSDI